MNNNAAKLRELEAQLQKLTDEFEQQMRARGFNPEQAENVALPTSLARLYADRLALIEQVDELKGGSG